MKNKRSIFVLAALFALCGAVAASAQVSLGARMGINSAAASIHLSYGDSYQTSRRIGLVTGIALEFGLVGPLSVRFEPQYVQKGYRLQDDYLGDELTVVGHIDYVELPMLLKGAWDIGRVSLFAFAGPNIGVRSSAEVAELFPDSTEVSSVEYATKDFDVALDLGLGIGYKVNPTAMVIADVRYSYGLVNIDNGGRGDIYQSRDIKVMLGMMFMLQ